MNTARKIEADEEVWVVVAGFERYEVSNLGRVRVIKTGHIMASTPRRDNGYIKVGLIGPDGIRTMGAHGVVARAFIPNPENKPQVNHKDGDRTNNAVTNLEWVTGKENRQHAKKRGTSGAATNRNFRFRLSARDVMDIRSRLALKEPAAWIAKDYGVDPTHVYRIRDRDTWAEAPTPTEAHIEATRWRREIKALCEFILEESEEFIVRHRAERILSDLQEKQACDAEGKDG